MKKIIAFIMLFGLSICVLSAQTVKMKKDPVGKWTFDAPYAPYGYTTITGMAVYSEGTVPYTMKKDLEKEE